jgi:hypothetical protein
MLFHRLHFLLQGFQVALKLVQLLLPGEEAWLIMRAATAAAPSTVFAITAVMVF